jgi:NADH-quinone oxidoreductase subunit D
MNALSVSSTAFASEACSTLRDGDGRAMHDRYPQFGGVAEDLPKGFYAECRRFCADMPKRIDEYLDLLAGNPVWKSRYQGIGAIAAETAIAMGLSGPNLRASGVPYDIRRSEPYMAYDQLQFDVITREGGDAYDRFMCRTLEMYESVKLVEQCLDSMPAGPVMADDRKYVLPPRHELHTSMESLIHHFKLVTEGFRVRPARSTTQSSRRVGSSAATWSPTAGRSRGGRTSGRRAS